MGHCPYAVPMDRDGRFVSFFFFSSRRRHTRCSRDWSSDVCSSDLVAPAERERWLRAAWLHDALRDATAADELAHGPMAADRAARDGETDPGVLDEIGRASCRERV